MHGDRVSAGRLNRQVGGKDEGFWGPWHRGSLGGAGSLTWKIIKKSLTTKYIKNTQNRYIVFYWPERYHLISSRANLRHLPLWPDLFHTLSPSRSTCYKKHFCIFQLVLDCLSFSSLFLVFLASLLMSNLVFFQSFAFIPFFCLYSFYLSVTCRTELSSEASMSWLVLVSGRKVHSSRVSPLMQNTKGTTSGRNSV